PSLVVYTLSLHDALPISGPPRPPRAGGAVAGSGCSPRVVARRGRTAPKEVRRRPVRRARGKRPKQKVAQAGDRAEGHSQAVTVAAHCPPVHENPPQLSACASHDVPARS